MAAVEQPAGPVQGVASQPALGREGTGRHRGHSRRRAASQASLGEKMKQPARPASWRWSRAVVRSRSGEETEEAVKEGMAAKKQPAKTAEGMAGWPIPWTG